MKRALLYLGFSVFILGLIISYDVTKCDGKVLMRPILALFSDEVTLMDPEEEIPMPEREMVFTPIDEEVREDLNLEEVPLRESTSRGFEYYYIQLNDQEKEVYEIMYDAYNNVETGQAIPVLDEASMNKVANYLRMDHPEFFYVETMGYTNYTLGGQVQKTLISAKYSDSKSVINMERESIDRVADDVIASFPDGADDYTKVKMVYEWVINNTEYQADVDNNQNMKSVFFEHKSVCAGYSKAVQYILNRAGVPTTCLDGQSLVTGESHAWNLCYVDGEYYYVDATWGDASYSGRGYTGENKKEKINYDYLLVTTEEIKRTHIISSDLIMPYCTATDNNYYVREGLYIMGYDHEQIAQIFERAYDNGEEFVSFKCASLEIFDDVRRKLIKDSGVFEFIRGDNSTISYVEDEEQRTICFWL